MIPSMPEQYKLELPGGAVEIGANDDAEAQTFAQEYLKANLRVPVTKPLHLFRYPKGWANHGGTLIEVPFVTPDC